MDKNERLDEYYQSIDRLAPAKRLIIAVLLGFIFDLSIVLVIFLILDLL